MITERQRFNFKNMEKEKLIRLDIMLKPSVEAGEKVIGLSRGLGEKYKHEFVLDGKNFFPHLTIIRLKDFDEADRVVKEIEWEISSFKSDTVAIYKMGEHGTYIELVKEFKLN